MNERYDRMAEIEAESKNPLISIIVPIFNLEKYLETAITSIREQTYKNIEIILVDDGSTDNSLKLCRILEEQDPRITVIHQANSGVSEARNTGLQAASGEYIGFFDADDYAIKDMYETLYINMKKYSADISCVDFLKTYDVEMVDNIKLSGGTIECVNDDAALKMFFQRKLDGNVWSKLFKRSVIEGAIFPKNEAIAEDKNFVLQTLFNCKSVVIDKTIKYVYIQRRQSATFRDYSERSLSSLRLNEVNLRLCEAKKPDLISYAYENYYYTLIANLEMMIASKALPKSIKKAKDKVILIIKKSNGITNTDINKWEHRLRTDYYLIRYAYLLFWIKIKCKKTIKKCFGLK